MNWFSLIFTIIILLLIDIYVFQAVSVVSRKWNRSYKMSFRALYWLTTGYVIISILFYKIAGSQAINPSLKRWSTVLIFVDYVSKFLAVIFLFIDDIRRIKHWIKRNRKGNVALAGEKITRSDFLMKSSLAAAAIPAFTLGFGVVSGAYDYKIRRKRIIIPNLPKAFDGIKLGQLSDIHSGSFFNKTAVQGGVDMLINENVDIFTFTGDLVNTQADEVGEYKQMFSKIKAPLGTFSTLGNHDYGDYRSWGSVEAKQKNLADLAQVHKEMGWNLLRNENEYIEVDGEKLAIIGVENWGAGRFSKYGDLEKAYRGTEDAATKILLSHDPSHWDAQVRTNHTDIDLMLAGHTHGFQFGVEIGNFRWSPSKYLYKQWADLYQEGSQQLYVNRGFGFIGYPGRVGILPEIAVLELVRA